MQVSSAVSLDTITLPNSPAAELVEFNSKPLFSFFDSADGLVVASAGATAPTAGDWSCAGIGGGSGGRQGVVTLGGILYVCSGSVLGNPDSLSVYALIGVNPALTSAWELAVPASLPVGDAAHWQFSSWAGQLAAVSIGQDKSSELLGGSTDPVNVLLSAAPSTDPFSWSALPIASDREPPATSLRFVEANGQLAYAQLYSFKAGASGGGEGRCYASLVWAHYLP
jgi:hypothetical protein